MGYFQVRYDSRVVNYDRRGFIRLATGGETSIVIKTYPVRKISPRCSVRIFF